MPDFSGASLKLVATGEGQVIATMDRIDQRAQKLYTRLSDYEKLVAAEHLARMRQQEAADREYARSLEVLAAQQKKYEDEVAGEWLARMRQASEGTEVISHSAARGLGELGRGLGNVARSGELGAFSLREFTGAAFRLGAEVGGAGLGAAIGLSVLAIGTLVEAFGKSGEAAKKANEEFQHYIETLVHGSVVEASLAKAKLYSGDPTALLTGQRDKESDIAYHARVGGQQFLESEQARLTALRDAAQKAVDQSLAVGPGEGVGHDPKALKDLKSYTAQLKEVNDLLNTNDLQLARISGVYDMLMGKEKELAKAQLEQRRDKLDSRSVGEYTNDDLNRIVQRIKSSHELAPALVNEGTLIGALRVQEAGLRYELERGNLTADERIAKMKELERTQRELNHEMQNSISILPGVTLRLNIQAAKLPDESEAVKAIKATEEKMKQEADRIGHEIGRTLAHGITDGIKTWFSGGGFVGGFKAMTAAILDGLGQMFAEVAEKALIGSTIMQKVISAIQGMNPWVAAVAAGALLAFGNSLRSSSSSGGSGGGGYSGGGSLGAISTIGTLAPQAPAGPVANPSHIMARPSTTNNLFVIGKDAKAWREVQEQLDQNARRG